MILKFSMLWPIYRTAMDTQCTLKVQQSRKCKVENSLIPILFQERKCPYKYGLTKHISCINELNLWDRYFSNNISKIYDGLFNCHNPPDFIIDIAENMDINILLVSIKYCKYCNVWKNMILFQNIRPHCLKM